MWNCLGDWNELIQCTLFPMRKKNDLVFKQIVSQTAFWNKLSSRMEVPLYFVSCSTFPKSISNFSCNSYFLLQGQEAKQLMPRKRLLVDRRNEKDKMSFRDILLGGILQDSSESPSYGWRSVNSNQLNNILYWLLLPPCLTLAAISCSWVCFQIKYQQSSLCIRLWFGGNLNWDSYLCLSLKLWAFTGKWLYLLTWQL